MVTYVEGNVIYNQFLFISKMCGWLLKKSLKVPKW